MMVVNRLFTSGEYSKIYNLPDLRKNAFRGNATKIDRNLLIVVKSLPISSAGSRKSISRRYAGIVTKNNPAP